jgi:hypothetical protein
MTHVYIYYEIIASIVQQHDSLCVRSILHGSVLCIVN